MGKNVIISPEKRFMIDVLYDTIQTFATIFSSRMLLNGVLKVAQKNLVEQKRANDLKERELNTKQSNSTQKQDKKVEEIPLVHAEVVDKNGRTESEVNTGNDV